MDSAIRRLNNLGQDLREELKTLTNDSEFLQSGLRKSKEIYEKKGSKAIPQRAACVL